MRIVFCGSGWLPMVDVIRSRLPPDVTIRLRDAARPLAEEVRDAEVLLPSNAGFDAELISAARRVLLIQQPAVGVDGIDLDAARARGIPVCNAPDTNQDSVAEVTAFLLLALARRLPLARRAFAAATVGEPIGVELRGKTLGIVGLGRAGSRVAAIATAMGLEVLGVRSSSPPGAWAELLARSDFVSLHCPLTPRTRGFFDAAMLARMKPGACLVNVARGPIVDRPALEAALASGRLGGAGLDVFEREPVPPDHPILSCAHVVLTPHNADQTPEGMDLLNAGVVDNVIAFLEGRPQNVVT